MHPVLPKWNPDHKRRGAILVLAALLMVMVFAFAAFVVDAGYMSMVGTELQNVADSAALAGVMELNNGTSAASTEAIGTGAVNKAAGANVTIKSSDITFGKFDLTTRTFTPNHAQTNSIRVYAKVDNHKTFFAPVLGKKNFSMTREAIAMLNPRDICFLVDLSGSMNNDTEPCWATNEITTKLTPQGYPSVASDLMQQLYTDLNFGTYPGTYEWIGKGLTNVPSSNLAYGVMTQDNGPLAASTMSATYKIATSDSEATRKTKAYKWIIDNQLARLMPEARPVPSSSNATALAYYTAYLDYIIENKSFSNTSATYDGFPRKGSNTSVTLPPTQDTDRITSMGNPDNATFPSASTSVPNGWRTKVGYITYVQFMMDFGRDRSPDISAANNAVAGVGTKVQLSTQSPFCRYHNESTPGGTFSFPPSEQPTHSLRRAMIAAIQEIKTRNAGLPAGVGDWVSIVTFDSNDAYHGAQVRLPLTSDYNAAMQSCTTMQAVGDIGASTATEQGMQLARTHLKPTTEGGAARTFTTKVLVLLTDGAPNLYQSSTSTINTYITQNPGTNWWSGSYPHNAALMQTSQMKGERDKMFPVAIGLGADMDFMDKMARMGGTADNSGLSPRGSGNPANYEATLVNIFKEIINTRGGRLVQ